MARIMSWRLVIVVIVALLAGACSKDPAQLFEHSKALHAKGDYRAAIVELKAAIQAQPENAAFRFQLGRIYNEVFDGFSAEKELRKAEELGLIEGGRVSSELAKAFLRQRNFKAIAEEIKSADAYEPQQRALIHALKGHANLTLGQTQEAREQLKSAFSLSPELSEAVLLQARLMLLEKKFGGSLALIDSVLKRDPKQFDALTMRAGMMRLTRNDKEELAAYDNILSINPNYLDALVGRSTVYLRLGRIEDAQKDVGVLVKYYKGNPLTSFQQGLVSMYRNKYREALEFAMVTLKRAPDFGPAMILAGLNHLALGAPQQAERILAKYVVDNPQSQQGRRLLAQALVEVKQGGRAVETLSPLLQKEVLDGELLALASEAYQQLGDNREASKLMAKAAASAPDDDKIAYRQAMQKLQAGELDAAIADLERTAKTADGTMRADALRFLALTYKGDLEGASKVVRKLEEQAPKHVLTHALKGHLLLLKEDTTGARASFEMALKVQPSYFPAAAQLAALDVAANDVEAARKRMEGVLAADKKNLDAALALAQIEWRSSKPERALELLAQASTDHPNAIEPRERRVKLLTQMGDKARARAVAEEALALQPDNPRALQMMAALQMLSGENNSAVTTASRLISIDRKSAEAYTLLARAQIAVGDLKSAEVTVRQALTLAESSQTAQELLVSLLMRMNRSTEAMDFARRLQKRDAKLPNGYVLEGDLHAAQSSWAKSIAAYRQALALGAKSDVDVKLFRARVKHGEQATALEDLRRVLEKRPTDAVIQVEVADELMRIGNFRGAAEQYAQVVRLIPGNALLLNNLAWAYFKISDPKALPMAEEAHRLNRYEPSIADTLGWILLESGQLAKGFELIEKAAATAPKNADIQYHYAFALAKNGNKDKARIVLHPLLASDQRFSLRKEAEVLAEKLK